MNKFSVLFYNPTNSCCYKHLGIFFTVLTVLNRHNAFLLRHKGSKNKGDNHNKMMIK